ncbi:PTB domain-containing engulfment adapter protein 1-like [Amphiura filiformis]|uniref:PTB domain-containing engulfment adapter protein 1-like n=1 Tax=Amphiura filiformis TaxID=82378 RepID=UPI003B22526C
MRKANQQRTSVKQWIHPPQALTSGHVVYNVKLLGSTTVDSSKGSEVVREAVRKLKFNKQVKRTEGEKPPKVELTISASGVGIQNRQTKAKLHTFPLHRISYCADDKSDKKICAFISKEETTETHVCYVMESEKAAEDITLTVGQAFDLAYQNFMQGSGKEMELKKQVITLQKKVHELEVENMKLRSRLVEVETSQNMPKPPAYTEHNSQVPPSQPPTVDLFEAAPFPSGVPSPGTPQGAAMTVTPQGNGTTNGHLGPEYATVPSRQKQPNPENANVPAISPPPPSSKRRRAQTHPLPPDTAQSPKKAVVTPVVTGMTPVVTGSPSANVPTPASPPGRPRPHAVAASVTPGIAPPPKSTRSRAGTTPGSIARPVGSGGAASDPFGQAPFSGTSPQQGRAAAAGDPFGSPTGSGQFSMDVDNQLYMDNQMKEMQVS